ncbi:MAG: ROK family protein [Christensenellaceae bacterium]|nr:ROK family protein [Christensenellaceae bacterium]
MYLAGIDLGGTAIKAGLVDENLKLVCKTSVPTGVGRPYQEIVFAMAQAVLSAAREKGISPDEIASVGIGIPGVAPKGIAIAINMYWHGIPLEAEMRKHLDVPVYIDNDATVAAVYEYHLGALAGCSVGVLLTLGTGIGGGIVINGKPFSGAHGLGSELGHMPIVHNGIQCTCGNKGCLEVYASASALIAMGRRCVIEQPKSMLHHLTGGDYLKVTPKMIFDCAKEGDRIALSIVEEYVDKLKLGICAIENALDPDVIAIGGGISGAGEFLLDRIIRASEGVGIFNGQKYADIRLAVSGNDAGVIGAAMLGLS